MRILLIIAVLITAPSITQAQRTFRASSIDQEQTERLDKSEQRDNAQDARIDRIEANIEKITELLSARPAAEESEPAAKAEKPVVTSEPSPVSLPRSYIVKETLPGCLPCKQWDDGPRELIESFGWTVIDEELTEPGGRAPRFRVVVSGKEYRHQGSLSFGDLHRIMDRHNGVEKKPVQRPVQRPVSQSYGNSQLSASIHAYRPGGWQGAVYRGVNEQRMSVYTHLTRDHGFSQQQVSGLSHDEALILHDNQHGPINQRISPARQASLVALPSGSQQQVGCALGGCAVQSTVNYSNNSNGWYLGKNLGR